MTEMNKVRPVIEWFTGMMWSKLQQNTKKVHWKKLSYNELFKMLVAELVELNDAHGRNEPNEEVLECADVANIAMMLADKARGRKK